VVPFGIYAAPYLPLRTAAAQARIPTGLSAERRLTPSAAGLGFAELALDEVEARLPESGGISEVDTDDLAERLGG